MHKYAAQRLFIIVEKLEDNQFPSVENLGYVNYGALTRWMITWPLK